jgi:Flp pilus assembly protein TadD
LLEGALANIPQQSGNRLFLASCRGNEGAPEAGERGLGLLMYQSILGLCGPATDPTLGTPTLRSLHAFLSNTLGVQQQPHLFGAEQLPLTLIGELPAVAPSQVLQTIGASTPYPSQGGFPSSGQAWSNSAATYPSQSSSQPMQPASSATQQQSEQWLNQARQLMQVQNLIEALSIVEGVLQIEPRNTSAMILKGQLLGTMGRIAEALAVIEQLIQLDPNNALAWSMQAFLLTNAGQHQAALAVIEHSLELDAHNPETYAIKNTITANMAAQMYPGIQSRNLGNASYKQSDNARSFLLGAGIQLLGFVIGVAGGAILVLQPTLPKPLAFSLLALGLAFLCVNAVRGAYLYGILRLLLTVPFCLLAAVPLLAVVAYRPANAKLFVELRVHPTLLIPLLFLGGWLALAAVLPFALAFLSFIVGLLTGVRRRMG